MASKSSTKPGVNLVEVLGFLVLSYMLSFRFISVLLLPAPVIIAHYRGRGSRWFIATLTALFLSMLSPVDLPLLGMYRGGGLHRSGPRLIRCTFGYPAHTGLIKSYGEYYWLGCSSGTLNPPRWVLVFH